MGRDGQRLCSQHYLLKGDLGGRGNTNLQLRDLQGDLLFPTHGGLRRGREAVTAVLYQQLVASN